MDIDETNYESDANESEDDNPEIDYSNFRAINFSQSGDGTLENPHLKHI